MGTSDNKKHVKGLSPKDAAKLLHDDPRALLIDVRSSMEFLFVGHPEGSVHVPWIDEPDWKVNENFATDIRKLLLGGVIRGDETHSAPIVLICRSGIRSLEAGQKYPQWLAIRRPAMGAMLKIVRFLINHVFGRVLHVT
jgi:rhodanese-related sulfurtransferase